jgi:peptide/nickel transport system ATP-binding protein
LLSAIPGSSTPAPSDLARVSLRGSPPNPRYPPEGCPFATRCPAKVRPERFATLPDETWEAIETFRNVLRARARRDEPVTRSLLRRVGIGSGEQSIDAISADLFGDVELPPDVAETVEQAKERAHSSPGAGADLLAEEFGSVCDRTDGQVHQVGDGEERRSQCVRHETDRQSPSDVLR